VAIGEIASADRDRLHSEYLADAAKFEIIELTEVGRCARPLSRSDWPWTTLRNTNEILRIRSQSRAREERN
jgi:hypothetical protein